MRSDIKAKMHHVAVLDYVVAALESHLTGFLRAVLSLAGDVIREADDFGADESLLEVGVNDARRLRRGAAVPDGPRANFLRPRGEEVSSPSSL